MIIFYVLQRILLVTTLNLIKCTCPSFPCYDSVQWIVSLVSVGIALCWDYWRKENKRLRCSDGYRFQLLPLNKLLSATHIIRLSGEIVRLWRREREKKSMRWAVQKWVLLWNKISQWHMINYGEKNEVEDRVGANKILGMWALYRLGLSI